MKNRFGSLWMILPTALIILVDIYVFQAVKSAVIDSKLSTQRWVYGIYWGLASITYLARYPIFKVLRFLVF